VKQREGDGCTMREPQLRLFPADAFAADSDLGRLTTVLEVLPDEALCRALDRKDHPQGRNKNHTARQLLHVMIAGVVFRHEKQTLLLDELKRNSDLRDAVGLWGAESVPKDYDMSRFLPRLLEQEALIEAMVAELVHEIRKHFPDFGLHQAIDGMEVHSYARGKSDPAESSDPEATWGVKTRRSKRKDGSLYEQVYKWFGYKLHLLVDTQYELPLAFRVTTASHDEAKELLPLIDQAASHLAGEAWDREAWEDKQAAWAEQEGTKDKPEPVSRVFEGVALAGDKAHDQESTFRDLHQQYRMKPVVPLVEHWDKAEGLSVYDRDRHTRVQNEETGEYADLTWLGYEKDRETSKYGCPCDGTGPCPYFGARCNKSRGGPGALFRIKVDENWRYYPAIARDTKKWDREYNKRSAVERVNSRLALLEIKKSGYRGHGKIAMRCALGVLVMLAHAVACLRAGKPELVRTLSKAAA